MDDDNSVMTVGCYKCAVAGGSYTGGVCQFTVCTSRSSCQSAGNAGREIIGDEHNAAGMCTYLGYSTLVSWEPETYTPSCGSNFGKANWNGSSFPWQDYGGHCNIPNTLLKKVVCSN
jgi:hypothetical protein